MTILVSRRRNSIFGAELFDEGFGTLDLGGLLGWTKSLDPGRLKLVSNAGHEWRLRAYHGKIDSFFLRKGKQIVQRARCDRHALRDLSDARIPRSTIKLCNQRADGKRPGQSVLTPARADE